MIKLRSFLVYFALLKVLVVLDHSRHLSVLDQTQIRIRLTAALHKYSVLLFLLTSPKAFQPKTVLVQLAVCACPRRQGHHAERQIGERRISSFPQ